ncbi:hypothetical protein, partial [Castellaniella defragrans]
QEAPAAVQAAPAAAPAAPAPAPASVAAAPDASHPIALPSLDESLQAAGMQMVETRSTAPYVPPAPPKPLGRARKPAARTQDEPLQQVETSH